MLSALVAEDVTAAKKHARALFAAAIWIYPLKEIAVRLMYLSNLFSIKCYCVDHRRLLRDSKDRFSDSFAKGPCQTSINLDIRQYTFYFSVHIYMCRTSFTVPLIIRECFIFRALFTARIRYRKEPCEST